MLARSVALIEQGLKDGLHIGAQLHVWHRDRVVADLAIGQAKPGAAMRPETAMVWLSAGKPVTAIAVCQLWERGRLDLHDPVARFIPTFAAHGKADTLWHLLTHTASVRAGILPKARDWDQRVAAISGMRPEPRWVPGRRAGYSAANNWMLLGEVVRRVDGRRIEDYVHDEILVPLRLANTTMAVSRERYPDWAPRLGVMYHTDRTPPQPAETHPIDHDIPPRPGRSMHGPARELAAIYQMLLRGGTAPDGRQLLRPETVAAMTSRQRHGLTDETFKRPVDWGLGLLLNTHVPHHPPFAYGYGPHASPDTFGHSGMQSSVGCCDRTHGLVIAAIFNGMPGDAAHATRQTALMQSLYEDLGLT